MLLLAPSCQGLPAFEAALRALRDERCLGIHDIMSMFIVKASLEVQQLRREKANDVQRMHQESLHYSTGYPGRAYSRDRCSTAPTLPLVLRAQSATTANVESCEWVRHNQEPPMLLSNQLSNGTMPSATGSIESAVDDYVDSHVTESILLHPRDCWKSNTSTATLPKYSEHPPWLNRGLSRQAPNPILLAH